MVVTLLTSPLLLGQIVMALPLPLLWKSLVNNRVGVGKARCVIAALLLNRPMNPQRLMNGRPLFATPFAIPTELRAALLLRKKQLRLSLIRLTLLNFYTKLRR